MTCASIVQQNYREKWMQMINAKAIDDLKIIKLKINENCN